MIVAATNPGEVVLIVIGGLLALALWLLPAIIAFRRGHAYKWIILIMAVFGVWTVLLWLAAIIWAVYPAEKSLIDPVVGNPTGTGYRNAGDTIGSAQYGAERGYAQERSQSPGSQVYCTSCGTLGLSTDQFCGTCGQTKARA